MRLWAASLLSALGLLSAAAATPAPAATLVQVPDVTVIGDSVMTGVTWHAGAVSIMQDGLEVRWEVAVCRTLTGVSCPFDGKRPPTLVDLVDHAGSSLGSTAVVEAGYNDPAGTFAQAVEDSVDALVAAGVKQILWLNLREVRPQFVEMNRDLAAAAARHPELQILDWNDASVSCWGWFQSDGIHLTAEGGVALATFVHPFILRALAPPLFAPPRLLPPAQVGRPYRARVTVTGGRAPYRWRSVGALPPGLHLRPDGRIDGVPLRRGAASFELHVTDAIGSTTTEHEQIRVEPGRS